MTFALAWSGLGRSMPVQNWKPARPPEEQTLVCELCPSTPQLASTRSVKPSSPGRPRCTMISFCRCSLMAARMREARASSASSQLTRSHSPLPRALERVQDPVRVGDLVDGGRSLGAVTAAGAGVLGVALELAHPEGLAVHVG